MDLGKVIHKKALEYGYDNCGVIPLEALNEYKDRLEERIAKFPESAAILGTPRASLHLRERFPWAKSAIVCTEYYGKYKFPASLQGMYAKSFLSICQPNNTEHGSWVVTPVRMPVHIINAMTGTKAKISAKRVLSLQK